MSERTNLLVQQWLQQSTQATTEELEQWTLSYPYFSAAQLLLLKRINPDSENFAAQKHKAALHVYNPMHLEASTEMFDFPFEEENAEAPVATPEQEHPFEEDRDFAAAEQPVEAVTADEREIDPFEIPEKRVETAAPIIETDATPEAPLPPEAPAPVADAPAEPSLELPSLDLSAPAAAAADITFEPYHTVDYFASQGIKLSQAEVPGDKFGKQLKSFTEWLKTMKKLPTIAITSNTDGVGEKKVERLAAHSLQNTEIITESMAEVWVKQGNIEKASEVYNKLSLQNPSKKAYFAAKIESLKKPS